MSDMLSRERLHLIDALRSVAIINMIIYHLFYDITVVYGFAPNWIWTRGAHIYQQCICHAFILLSGISWNLGRSRILQRGIIVNICGLIITAVTFFFMPGELIIFGILNCIGMCMILSIPLERIMERLSPYVCAIISLFLFGFTRHIQRGYLMGFPFRLDLPKGLYSFSLGIPFGLPPASFESSDYFPIIPWIFLYIFGISLGRILISSDKASRLFARRIPLLSAMGRYSLPIYMLHQVVCMLLCILLFGLP